jgi:hypothetical protein
MLRADPFFSIGVAAKHEPAKLPLRHKRVKDETMPFVAAQRYGLKLPGCAT